MEELASLDGLAGALADALLALALSAPPAQSADRSATTPVTGGKTLLKLDGGTAAVLTDAGISIRATGPAVGPAGSPVFAFPIVGGEVKKSSSAAGSCAAEASPSPRETRPSS